MKAAAIKPRHHVDPLGRTGWWVARSHGRPGWLLFTPEGEPVRQGGDVDWKVFASRSACRRFVRAANEGRPRRQLGGR